MSINKNYFSPSKGLGSMEKEELGLPKEQNMMHKDLIGFLKEQNKTAIELTAKQVETNTKMLEKLNKLDLLDEMNFSLKGVNEGFGKVLVKYDNFSTQMVGIEKDIKWAMIIILAMSIPIAASLIKIAFF